MIMPSIPVSGRNGLLVIMLIALILTISVIVFIPSVMDKTWVLILLIPVLLLGTHYWDKLRSLGRISMSVFSVAIMLIYGFNFFRTMYSLTISPPIWDFQTFWLSGHVAAQRLNFYEPQNYHDMSVALNLTPDEEFSQEILDVGSLYPPMTMFLFLPLGWFDMQSAAILWYGIQGVFLIIDIILMWKLFLSDAGLKGLVLVSALTFMFPPVINNIWFAQINLILLFILLLFWRDHEIPRAGIWLAIGLIIKPYIALLFIYLLIKRQWKVVWNTLLTLAGITLLSLIVFGPATFFGYFASNPAAKLPAWYFSELGNGSLYALVWRLIMRFFGEEASTLIRPIFVSISVLLLGITSWLVYRLGSQYDQWVLAILLSLALFLYPNTGTNYCGVLLLPILLYWKHREKILGGVWGFVIFVTLESAFFGYHDGWSNFVILGVAFAWFMFLAICIYLLWQQKRQPGITSQ